MHDLQWVVTVQSGVFKLISGLQTSNSIFSKVDKMELEHYSIHPTKLQVLYTSCRYSILAVMTLCVRCWGVRVSVSMIGVRVLGLWCYGRC